MNQYTIHDENRIDAEYGQFTIPVTVNGYWSNDPISIYVSRNGFSEKKEWSIEVSHSSGGRDTDKFPDHLQASENFAQALLAAVKYSRELEKRFPEFEEAYQKRKDEDKKIRLVEEAELILKIDADAPLGEEKAKELIEMLSNNRKLQINVIRRGHNTPNYLVTAKHHGNLVMYWDGCTTSKKEAIQLLSMMSHHTFTTHW